MVKPHLDVRGRTYRLAWATRSRPAELLHWTVLRLGALAKIGCSVETLRHLLDDVVADPFMLSFDRVRCAEQYAVLEGGRTPSGVARLRSAIVEILSGDGVQVKITKSRPHVTLDYNYAGTPSAQPIDPIHWEVDRFILVESVIGETRHVHHGEWRLIPRQGTLFPLRSCAF